MKKKLKLHHWQVINIGLFIYDILAVNVAYFLGLWIRFDCQYSEIPEYYLESFLKFAPVYTAACIVVFLGLRLYRSIWRFASYSELLRVAASTVLTFIIQVAGTLILVRRMPVSYYMIGTILQFMAVLGIRFSYRFVLLERGRRRKEIEKASRAKVMVIGAGEAGQMIIRDILKGHHTKEQVRCVIDDNKNKWNRFVEGVPVVGGRDTILYNVEKYHIDKIYIAIPSASAKAKKEILEICKDTGCELKNLPGMYQLMNGDVTVSAMKDVAIEDLLGREQIQVKMDEIFAQLSGKTILVTGGGGSIGSELCRQISAHNPKQLLIFDIYENNAYDIQNEIKKKYPELNLTVLIGSVQDSRRVNKVFATYKPDIVFHAAAHKHVPLMEDSPNESIKNNVMGTYKTARAAMVHGCKRFVLISTDKAVNPTNIMGASKRLCEMVIQTFDYMIKAGKADQIPELYAHAKREGRREDVVVPKDTKTEFVAVRFGNVLGSNGSVIPLFKKQIAAGGPVTVTHPEIIRYFMTIPEAVSLVLQAATYANGGEIFVLDMGSPVKIDTLARNLIKLSGHKPDVDIKIEYTGLRPGEKLYEEKLMAEEGLKKTDNDLIHIGCPIAFDMETFLDDLSKLFAACYGNSEEIKEVVQGIVTTYKPF